MRNYYQWSGRGYMPSYDDRADYQTNSKSYLDFLAKSNKAFGELIKQLEYLAKRDITVEDTNTVDLTKIGQWLNEITDEEQIDPIIKLKADVLISKLSEPLELKSLSVLPHDVRDVLNAIKAKTDGIYSKDLEPYLKEIDTKLDELIERIDTLDPEGADVAVNIDTAEIEPSVPVPYKNLDSVIGSVDKTKFNIAFITDLHLQPQSNHTKGNPYFRILEQFERLASVCDVAVHNGDNIDGYSGAQGVDFDVMPPSEVKYSTRKNMERFVHAVLTNRPVETLIVQGNHDRGGIPYATSKNHDLQMVLSKNEMKEISGQPLYEGKLFPDKKVAIYKMYADDFSEKTSNGYFVEGDTQEGLGYGLISFAQFNNFKTFLTTVPDGYTLIIFSHIITSGDKTGNGLVLESIFNAIKDKTKVTIPANSLTGADNQQHGSLDFDFTNRNIDFAGVYAGHFHTEVAYPRLDSRKYDMAALTLARPLPEDVGTEKEGTFYLLELDTTAKTLKCKGIGKGTDFINYNYNKGAVTK